MLNSHLHPVVAVAVARHGVVERAAVVCPRQTSRVDEAERSAAFLCRVHPRRQVVGVEGERRRVRAGCGRRWPGAVSTEGVKVRSFQDALPEPIKAASKQAHQTLFMLQTSSDVCIKTQQPLIKTTSNTNQTCFDVLLTLHIKRALMRL